MYTICGLEKAYSFLLIAKFLHYCKSACLIKFPTNEILQIEIERTSEVVLLGITTDDQLTFKRHIENICRMAKYKLRALEKDKKLFKYRKG